MSSIYGSDALGGVINLISKDPNCERLEFEGSSYFESVGQCYQD
jgi:outer membrane receptor for ferrienterochelin and colicin